MKQISTNDTVTLQYEGKLSNGEVFASSGETGPLIFTIGDQSVLPGIEKAVLEMTEGETRTIELQPEDAFGPHMQDLVHTVNKKSFGENTELQVGGIVSMRMEKEGQQHQVPALVTKIEGRQVTVDFNHPLADKVLTYTLTVKEVKSS